MKKRNLIALLMVVCMMFSLLPVNAIAVGDEGPSRQRKRFFPKMETIPRRLAAPTPPETKTPFRTQAKSPVRRKSL